MLRGETSQFGYHAGRHQHHSDGLLVPFVNEVSIQAPLPPLFFNFLRKSDREGIWDCPRMPKSQGLGIEVDLQGCCKALIITFITRTVQVKWEAEAGSMLA